MFDEMRNPVPVWYLSQARATHNDIPQIVSIYRGLIGTPGCTWDEDYPGKESAERDINNGWLYIFKSKTRLLALCQ